MFYHSITALISLLGWKGRHELFFNSIFFMLISLIKWQKKKFAGTKSVSMSLFLSVAFFIFIGKANMHSLRVCIIVISKHNLKLKVFHVLVGYMRDFLFCVDIFNHALKNEISLSWIEFHYLFFFTCWLPLFR